MVESEGYCVLIGNMSIFDWVYHTFCHSLKVNKAKFSIFRITSTGLTYYLRTSASCYIFFIFYNTKGDEFRGHLLLTTSRQNSFPNGSHDFVLFSWNKTIHKM